MSLAVLMILAPVIIGERTGQFLIPYSHIVVGCLVALILDSHRGFARLEWLGRGWAPSVTLTFFIKLHFVLPHRGEGANKRHVPPSGTPNWALRRSPGVEEFAAATGGGFWVAAGVTIGKLSYGMHLVHLLALNLAEKIARPGTGNALVSVAALLLAYSFSVAAAYLLAIAIERPGIALGRRISAHIVKNSIARA